MAGTGRGVNFQPWSTGQPSTRRLPLLATSSIMKFLLIQIVPRSVEMELELTWLWSVAQCFSVSELSLFVFTQQT